MGGDSSPDGHPPQRLLQELGSHRQSLAPGQVEVTLHAVQGEAEIQHWRILSLISVFICGSTFQYFLCNIPQFVTRQFIYITFRCHST